MSIPICNVVEHIASEIFSLYSSIHFSSTQPYLIKIPWHFLQIISDKTIMVSVSLSLFSFKTPSIYFYAVPVYKGCPSHFRCLSHLMVPHVLLDLSCLLLSALLVSFPFFYYYFRISVILCPNSYTYLISCSITSTSFSCIPFIFQIYIFISFSLFRLFACIVTYLFPCSFRQFSISDGI